MTGYSHSIIRSYIRTVLLVVAGLMITGLVLYFTDLLSALPHLLYRARYGLLAWRLCLYTFIAVLWFRQYRRLPVQSRPHLKKLMLPALLLPVVAELSNQLQQGRA